ncbi:MAG: hypothetical protein AAFR71_05740 [Pseudomonadota bacterium]
MIVYVTSLVRYKPYGWLYKVDYHQKKIIARRKINSDNSLAKHGGPHGLASIGDTLVTGTYSDILFFDGDLKERGRFASPYLLGVHGLSAVDDRIWISSCNNEMVVCFDRDGNVIERFCLRSNRPLCDFFDLKRQEENAATGFLEYPEQPFHVNHVQEVDGRLLVCLHKQGCIWDLRAGEPVALSVGGQIHDAQYGAGGYLVNDTQGEKLCFFDESGHPLTSTFVKPYPLSSMMTRIRQMLGVNKGKVCRANWLRGLAPLGYEQVLVGSSPATILTVDFKSGKLVEQMKLSSDRCEAVFGILPSTAALN